MKNKKILKFYEIHHNCRRRKKTFGQISHRKDGEFFALTNSKNDKKWKNYGQRQKNDAAQFFERE
jgi:hypothetical protein